MPRRALQPSVLAFALLAGCYEAPCPAPQATISSASELSWDDDGSVPVSFRDVPLRAVLDTGFQRSAFGPSAEGTKLGIGTLKIGSASVTPLEPGALLSAPAAGVIGTDALQTLPFSIDPSRRVIRLATGFDADGDALETRAGQASCEAGVLGPLWFVRASFGGAARRMLLDTGAELTVIRRDATPERPRLSGVRVSTGFAGIFSADATRLAELSVSGDGARNVVALSSRELDAALDELAGGEPLDGLLGMSFLREFVIELDGKTEDGARTLRLSPHGAPLARHFVGVGISTTRVAEGLRIDGFLGVSPAREAGLLAGDVITRVNAKRADEVPQPWAEVGAPVRLTVVREGVSTDHDVTVADLLPDP